MKPRDLAALLRLLDKHPRVISCTVGTAGDVSLQLAEAPVMFQEAGPEADASGDLELPPGTPDPRATIAKIKARYAGIGRDGKVPS